MESQICQKCAKTHLQAEKVVNPRSGEIALWPCEAMMTVSYSVVTAICSAGFFVLTNEDNITVCSYHSQKVSFCLVKMFLKTSSTTHKLMLMFRPTSSSVHQSAKQSRAGIPTEMHPTDIRIDPGLEQRPNVM